MTGFVWSFSNPFVLFCLSWLIIAYGVHLIAAQNRGGYTYVVNSQNEDLDEIQHNAMFLSQDL